LIALYENYYVFKLLQNLCCVAFVSNKTNSALQYMHNQRHSYINGVVVEEVPVLSNANSLLGISVQTVFIQYSKISLKL